MIYSLMISALILGIAAFFGFQQKDRLTKLEHEWTVLSEQGSAYGIPTSPSEEYAPSRLSYRGSPAANTESVNDFSERLIVFMKETKEVRNGGGANNLEIKQRGIKMMNEMLDFSASDMRLLVENLIADSSIDEDSKGELMMMSIMMISQEQPETALALILETKESFIKSSQMRNHLVSTSIGQLAKNDPQAALEWMKANQEEIGGINDGMRSVILSAMASQDMKAAFSLYNDLKFESKTMSFSGIARAVTAESIDEFVAGIRSLEGEEGMGESVFRSLADSPFANDTDQAMAFLENGTLTPSEQTAFLNGLQYYKLKEDTGKWVGWMIQRKKGENAKELIRDWTRNDFQAAGEWINDLDKGRTRNSAVTTYAQTLAEHEPEAAAGWAESLPEGAARNSLRRDVYQQWKRQDPAAAAAYAAKYGLK